MIQGFGKVSSGFRNLSTTLGHQPTKLTEGAFVSYVSSRLPRILIAYRCVQAWVYVVLLGRATERLAIFGGQPVVIH